MPAAEEIVMCGLDISRDAGDVARGAVVRYREALFMRTFSVESPSDRTLLTALYYVQDVLSGLTADGKIGKGEAAVRVPGEPGFPGIDQQAVSFGNDEKEQARRYLQRLQEAVSDELVKAVNENEEVRKWWLSLQKRRFMNRMV